MGTTEVNNLATEETPGKPPEVERCNKQGLIKP